MILSASFEDLLVAFLASTDGSTWRAKRIETNFWRRHLRAPPLALRFPVVVPMQFTCVSTHRDVACFLPFLLRQCPPPPRPRMRVQMQAIALKFLSSDTGTIKTFDRTSMLSDARRKTRSRTSTSARASWPLSYSQSSSFRATPPFRSKRQPTPSVGQSGHGRAFSEAWH
jgi:hypothetical protein